MNRLPPWLRVGLLVAACLALGVAVGRFLTPPRIETKYQEDQASRVALTAALKVTEALRKQLEEATKVKRVVVTRWIKAPDGTETRDTTTTTERETTKTETTDRGTEVVKDETSEATLVSSVTTSKVVEAPKSWSVGVLVGVGGLGSAQTSPAVGAEFTGRVWGPVRIGGWGLYETASKRGAAGGSVSVEF